MSPQTPLAPARAGRTCRDLVSGARFVDGRGNMINRRAGDKNVTVYDLARMMAARVSLGVLTESRSKSLSNPKRVPLS